MAQLYLDAKADFTKWAAFLPNGTTASTALASAAETSAVRYGPDGKSVRLTGDSSGQGHLLRFGLPATDVTAYNEVRFYVRGDRPADGSPGHPFYLELHLGSAGLPTSAPGNSWTRLLPITQTNSWELVRCSLTDLPAQVRSGVSTVELRFVDASRPFSIVVDDLSAVRDEMLGDVESALIDRLHERLTIGGKKVPAVLANAAGQLPDFGDGNPPDTYFIVSCFQIEPRDLRQNAQRTRRDFVPQGGYALAPAIQNWALTYRIDAVAPDRTVESRLLEYVLGTLSSSAELVVASYPLPITFRSIPNNPALFYQVIVRQELGTPEIVRATSRVVVDIDYRAAQSG